LVKVDGWNSVSIHFLAAAVSAVAGPAASAVNTTAMHPRIMVLVTHWFITPFIAILLWPSWVDGGMPLAFAGGKALSAGRHEAHPLF
jgi:hypothetical protein